MLRFLRLIYYISAGFISLHTYFSVLLVEEVVVDFDFSVGFKVIRQQHNRNRHLVQIIDLPREETLSKHP